MTSAARGRHTAVIVVVAIVVGAVLVLEGHGDFLIQLIGLTQDPGNSTE